MPEKPLPNYEVVPLRSNVIRVGVIQCRNRTVDPKNPKPGMKENLEHMCQLIDYAQGFGVRKELMKDLLIFHEFPITGWNGFFTRDEQFNLALDVPGPETETIAQKAKQYDCYISFGSYAKWEGWEGHYINTGFIIGPTGEIVIKNWKKRQMPGSGFSTSIFDVLDKFVEMYGWDAVFPVARTDIGNFAFYPCAFEPEIVRAFAIKGAEILIRYYTNGAIRRVEMPVQCATNKIYGIFVNQAAYDGDCRFEDAGSGGCAVFDENGNMMAEASSHHETLVSANIPLAEYRKRHSIPIIRKELYQHICDQYEGKYPPNMYLDNLPKNKPDQVEIYRKAARW